MKYIPPADVYVGMVESTFKRLHKIKKVGLVIVDECHIAVFNKIHEEFPEAKVIGFSATPIASDKKKALKNYYEDIVCGPQISELIALKRLCQNITYAPKNTVDRDSLKVKGKDFDDELMSLSFRKPKHINSTIEAYIARGVGLKTMIFNVNLQHSRDVTKAFNDSGYPCRHLGSDNEEERDEIEKWFSITPGAILSSVQMTTTGFDEPTVEHIIVNKATLSLSLWLQMCGRGGRIIKNLKYRFFITDMGGNAMAHGDWCQDRYWDDLFHFPDKPKKNPGVPPIKSCPKCEAIIPASAKKCPICEYEFPEKEVAPEELLNEFVVITKNINVLNIINENADKKEYFTLFEIGKKIASAFKEKQLELNENTFTFALQQYHSIAKVWTKERGKKFNQFHRNLIEKELKDNLKWHPPVV
jgi:hypothetical protein